MGNANYIKGRSREYQALKILRDDGWLCSRSAASHSAIDIFACKDEMVLLIQVKSGKARVTEKDRLELSKWKKESGCCVEIWYFGRKKEIEKEVIF